MEKKINCKYLVSIKGQNIDFECPINIPSDLDDVEEILEILKKKLQNS